MQAVGTADWLDSPHRLTPELGTLVGWRVPVRAPAPTISKAKPIYPPPLQFPRESLPRSCSPAPSWPRAASQARASCKRLSWPSPGSRTSIAAAPWSRVLEIGFSSSLHATAAIRLGFDLFSQLETGRRTWTTSFPAMPPPGSPPLSSTTSRWGIWIGELGGSHRLDYTE